MTGPAAPLPVTDDRDTGGFWDAAAQGRLVVRECANCEAVLHLPRAYCHRCGTWSEQWREVPGRARLVTWTVVEHQVHPGFPVPYTIVLVELEAAPQVRLVGRLEGRPELVAGAVMEVEFERRGDTTIPEWRPVT
jgi:uncharacterized OB-fold protein